MTKADIGIDLGTANVMIYINGKGIVLEEPSVVAIDKRTNDVIAIGKEAKDMIGKTPDYITAIRPIRDGVIKDYSATEKMLNYFIEKVISKKGLGVFFMPRIMVCVPSGLTDTEKRAVDQATRGAGSREVYIIEETLAAAVGAGINIFESIGNMIIDIGGGTTDVAVISLGGIVVYESVKIAGDRFDLDIVKYIKDKFNIVIGDRTAEKLKIEIGRVFEGEKKSMRVAGRDIITRFPKSVEITSSDIYNALNESIEQIIYYIKRVMDKTPPELLADISQNGIYITGGGALLRGIQKRIQNNLNVKVIIPEKPTICVAKGTGESLNSLELLEIGKGNK